jgi:drug/metabolite transporter (DMT)-like permease
MSGETTMLKHAVWWCLAAAVPVIGIAFAVRGNEGAASAAIAIGIALANAVVAALVSSAAGRLHTLAAGFVSLPSFAIRMGAILVALAFLKNAAFIDKPTFALTFGAAVTAVLVLEARGYVRTPWLALTLDGKKETP